MPPKYHRTFDNDTAVSSSEIVGRTTYLSEKQFVKVGRCHSSRASRCRAIVIALAQRVLARLPPGGARWRREWAWPVGEAD